jgi:hypothetical protein
MKPGRNDPCPCGSGRKYKNCCLRVADVIPDAERQWRRVRRALDPLSQELVREAQRHFGEIGLEEAWAEFFLFDAAGPFDPDSRFVPVFFSWFLLDWLPDPHGTELPAVVRDITVAEAFLARAGHRLDPIARRCVEACIATPYSFHEVLDCRPGAGFRLRDVMLGTEADVTEHTASKSVDVGDVLFGKLVSIDGLALIEGVGPTAIPPAHKTALIELRKALGTRQSPFGAETLREFADELRDLYLDIDASLNRLPELRNTDGDPLEMHTLIFDLDAPEAAFERLADLAGGFGTEVERDAAGRLLRADINWVRSGNNKMHKDWDNTTLGTLRIEGTRLTAEVNSAKRAAALRKLIERRLGNSARVRPSVVQSVQSLLEREPAQRARRTQRDREQADLAAASEVEAAIAEAMRSHYRSWVDQRLPALGNRTPRKAVRDPDGREAVEALVAQIERDTARMNPGLDLEFLRELRATLGLS